ncbi:hypothetical protein Ari01nite_22950 [Paractinoplanes rishiriensis]|uniref:Uncharacterized protein n=1 Tax=Paractinoplanes rishiriensis TaxID=1050105 RepID=A0A919JU39_9ACTN|nr:hypothetical protein Ari01nite_22950 [Actinoplanes rishiriensis]
MHLEDLPKREHTIQNGPTRRGFDCRRNSSAQVQGGALSRLLKSSEEMHNAEVTSNRDDNDDKDAD